MVEQLAPPKDGGSNPTPSLHRKPKARIHQNRWDNWYGYLGRRCVIAFPNIAPGYGAQQVAESWLEEQGGPKC